MCGLLRTFLVAILIVALAGAQVLAAPSQSLGVVMQAQGARLGGVEAVVGATVFSGDNLSTQEKGNINLRAGRAQLYLPASTSTGVDTIPSGIRATLRQGALFFGSGDSGVVEVRASEALIRSRNGQPAFAKVTLLGPNELEIASYRGTVDVTVGDETRAVTERTAYRVLTETEQAQGGAAPAGRRGKFIAILFFAGATIAAILIARHFVVSPDSP